MKQTEITPEKLAGYFDHTQLRAYAVKSDFEKLCAEAKKYGFAMVAVNPAPVALCRKLLENTDIHVGAAVGFLLGQNTIAAKVFETEDAIKNGAHEIDYVVNLTQLKEKNYAYIEKEMTSIVEICRREKVISKVIFENCYLTREEKLSLCKIAKETGPDFIKTSTGFGTGGATFEDVELMKNAVGDGVKIKAAGGIASMEDAQKFLTLGADRLGTSRIIKLVKNEDATGY